MALPNVFESQTNDLIFARLEKLQAQTQPAWGKMNAPQMLAHLNVTYDMAYGRVVPKTPFLVKLMLKLFVKSKVTNEQPYPKNSRTAPVFIIADERDFDKEKAIFKKNILETQQHGASFFEGKESVSFGVLNAQEWNNMFYKHIDHHFTQFGI